MIVLKTQTDINKMSQSDIVSALGITAQVTYADEAKFDPPLSLQLFPGNHPGYLSVMQFPFHTRFDDSELRRQFDEQFKKDFEGRVVAEVGRFRNFSNVPESVSDRMMLEILRVAMNKGVTTFIASSDDVTGTHVFFARKYKLLDYKLIPKKNLTSIPEYLQYTNVESRDFGKTLARLKRNGGY